jgi:hypothetical protein
VRTTINESDARPIDKDGKIVDCEEIKIYAARKGAIAIDFIRPARAAEIQGVVLVLRRGILPEGSPEFRYFPFRNNLNLGKLDSLTSEIELEV